MYLHWKCIQFMVATVVIMATAVVITFTSQQSRMAFISCLFHFDCVSSGFSLFHRKYTSYNEMKISTRVLWTHNKKVIYVILKLFLPGAETQNINGKMTKFHSSEPVEEIQNYIWPQSLWHRLVVSFQIESVRSSARFKRHNSI